jgi:hypothetical protein
MSSIHDFINDLKDEGVHIDAESFIARRLGDSADWTIEAPAIRFFAYRRPDERRIASVLDRYPLGEVERRLVMQNITSCRCN